jgi:hypothetical protein
MVQARRAGPAGERLVRSGGGKHGDAGRLLRALAIFCGVAFVGFAVAAAAIPEDRGSLQASATAFLVGAALAVAAGRSHQAVVARLDRLERQVRERGPAEPTVAADPRL